MLWKHNPICLMPSYGYYLMSDESNGGDQWYDDNTTVTTTSDLNAQNSVFYSSGYIVNSLGAHAYVPPNLTYGPGFQPGITAQSLGTLRNNFGNYVGFKIGTVSGTPVREMNWGLDPTGNWSSYLTKTSGTTDLSQTRTSNTVNEITAVSETGGTPLWATPAYDAAGNMTTVPQVATPTSSYTAVYDAWNRMVSLTAGSGTTYKYDGASRRIVKITTSPSETRHYYFTDQWQDIEERTGSTPTMQRQYVWGIRYVDDLICRDDSTSSRYYVMQDANFNGTSICNTSATVEERYLYDPYGNVTYMNASWTVISSSTKAWQINHQGLLQDVESGLIYNRSRILHSPLGCWLSRDSIEYRDDVSLYGYEKSNPIDFLDPSGHFYVQLFLYGMGIGHTCIAAYAGVQCWKCFRNLDAEFNKARQNLPPIDAQNYMQAVLNSHPCGSICADAGREGIRAAMWFFGKWIQFKYVPNA